MSSIKKFFFGRYSTHSLKMGHRSGLLRGQDCIALSSHTGSIPPIAKASRAADGVPGDHSQAIVSSVSFFQFFSKARDEWSRTLLCVTGSSFWLLSPFLFYCSWLLLCFGGLGVHLHNSIQSHVIGAG